MWVWWMLFLFLPVATFVLIAFPLGLIMSLSGWKPSPSLILSVWGCLSVIALTWCYVYDRESLTWTLTTIDLRRGKHWPKTIFRFDNVESIVIGVPVNIPWFLAWGRMHSSFRHTWALRRLSIFVRLRGGRRIALNFLSGQFLDGHVLMEQFTLLHAARCVGPDTYTGQELRRMQTARLNRVFTMSP
jgi:hypothetical protein